ncbi:MAG: hypothetical protein IPO92_08485 [Saprospiraceae bacterium]|nr:hypothetical protein [Saprospiraceae bacterium]
MKINLCYLIIGFLSLLSSCYQNKDGCLDTLATNFDVSADNACNKCCIYPSLMLNIKQMSGDSVYRSDSTLINDIGQKYKISDVRFYVSSFELFKKEQIIKINEYISNQDQSIYIPDDMKIYRSVDKNITIGTIKNAGTFDSLTFYIGLSETMLNTKFTNLPSKHVLDLLNALTKNSNLALFTAKIVRIKSEVSGFIRDSTLSISVLASGQSKRIKLKMPLTTKKGENLMFTVTADYFKIFQNLDLSQSIEVLENKVKQNISTGFIVN